MLSIYSITAVGIGSWSFHMTLQYEMQVSLFVSLSTSTVHVISSTPEAYFHSQFHNHNAAYLTARDQSDSRNSQ